MYLFLSIISFIVLFILFYSLSNKLNLIDRPNYRKIHKGNIPLIGGLVIYLNVLLYLLIFDTSYYFSIIFLTSSLLLILGSIDDSIGLGVTFRLISQLISCLIIIGSGLVVTNVGEYNFLPNINIGILSIIFTVFCVIGLTNAFNFIDGVDGLCGGMFLVSLFSLLIFSFYSETFYLIYDVKLIYIIFISVLLFLLFNFTSFYKVFLGDSGSMFLGFILSWFLIFYTQIEEIIHPVLALWCVTLPTFDIISVIIRRLLRKKNPFKADRRHIHHILLNIGYDSKIVTIFLLSFSLLVNFIGFITFIYLGAFVTLITFSIFLIFYLSLSIKLSRVKLKTN